MEFFLAQLPRHLLTDIFNKMSPPQFQEAFALNSYCKAVFETSFGCFHLSPLHHLDRAKKSQIIEKVQNLKEEYANAILKNIQDRFFKLHFMAINYQTNRKVNIEKVLEDLEAKIYWREGNLNCVFSSAPREHVFPHNLVIFTIRNKKNQIFRVKLTDFSLEIDRIETSNLLEEMWDAVRDSSSYPMPI